MAHSLPSTRSRRSTVERVSVVQRHGEYGTMDSSPEPFTLHHTLAVVVSPDPLNEVVSIHGGQAESSQLFGTGVHGVAPQRLRAGHFPSRSRLSHLDRTDRSPSNSGGVRHVCGRPRKSVGGPATHRHVCLFAADERPPLPISQWVLGLVTVMIPAKRASSMPGRWLLPSFLPGPARNGAAVKDLGMCRGKVHRPRSVPCFLQWGRDDGIAEYDSVMPGQQPKTQLQWGHAWIAWKKTGPSLLNITRLSTRIGRGKF